MLNMKTNDPAKVLAWLQGKPSQDALRTAFPAEWDVVEQQLAQAISEHDPSRLHRMLNPESTHNKSTLSRSDKTQLLQALIRQQMAARAIERYSLAVATGQLHGKVRFNLFNGLLAQKLLFKRAFIRKPVSLFWFRLCWPLVWQKRFLMPLVERKGIYCFYSRSLINQLRHLIAGRDCLEIGAGDGTLSRFLSQVGVNITATDDGSWAHRIHYPESVVRMDASQALGHYAPKVVICSWPPAQNSFEREVFRTSSVELYIVIVSQHRFASGNWDDYSGQKTFEMTPAPALSRLLLPPELGCQVLLFRRKP
jgi:hypothetical protein